MRPESEAFWRFALEDLAAAERKPNPVVLVAEPFKAGQSNRQVSVLSCVCLALSTGASLRLGKYALGDFIAAAASKGDGPRFSPDPRVLAALTPAKATINAGSTLSLGHRDHDEMNWNALHAYSSAPGGSLWCYLQNSEQPRRCLHPPMSAERWMNRSSNGSVGNTTFVVVKSNQWFAPLVLRRLPDKYRAGVGSVLGGHDAFATIAEGLYRPAQQIQDEVSRRKRMMIDWVTVIMAYDNDHIPKTSSSTTGKTHCDSSFFCAAAASGQRPPARGDTSPEAPALEDLCPLQEGAESNK